ncbi:lipid-A-disaccharide synthase [Asticcacaulis taihuensis]|uniref:lipid-A-disaccharide synthase n=1 Tax=Asticcacaulis taihuensis TaxID=260084 RepID=UPI0026ECD208|nr:lipid-A-disaccharide synthase [Asticcacaulis taihuensis]
MATMTTKRIMVVAAEASGDALGAGLIAELRRQAPNTGLTFFGVGGARMAEQGVVSPFDISELSILGLLEAVKAYGRVMTRVRETVAYAQAERPDVVILVDSWGFTLRVANAIRKVMPQVRLIKYVGPQVWAARPGRAKTLARSVDLLLALHPMDPPFFEAAGLKTIVVGNPALNIDLNDAEPVAFRKRIDLRNDPLLLVLLGSRPSEIKRLSPLFAETIARLSNAHPDLRLVMPVADTVRDLVERRVAEWPVKPLLVYGEADKHSAMKAAALALACSGTVSTELALAGCPMVIAYKVEPLTYWIYRRISTLKHVTMFNIMAEKRIAPEFIQNDATVDNLVQAVDERLADKSLRNKQIAEQFAALDTMGRGQKPPAEKAAAAVLEFLGLN